MNDATDTTPVLASLPPQGASVWQRLRRRLTQRRVLAGAVATSLAVHFILSLWPVEIATTPEEPPLAVTIAEMPPPPKPTPVAAVPKPKPKRIAQKAVPPPVPVTAPEPEPIAADQTSIADQTPVADAAPPAAETPVPPAPTEVVADEPESVVPEPPIVLPPRLELTYTVFLGTQGFMIGDATYRFEHQGNQYRIATVAQARGLAALLIRGKGKVESQGLITPTGLQPQEFAVERGSSDRREVARFDWEAGIVTLHDQNTAALELPTYDPLAVMWQSYFSPPTGDQQSFNIATTRRVMHYTVTREGTERIEWAQGEIETERWHRRSDDGKTDGYAWLAPSLHYVPVKLRVVATNRGTIEALLESIRVDEQVAQQ